MVYTNNFPGFKSVTLHSFYNNLGRVIEGRIVLSVWEDGGDEVERIEYDTGCGGGLPLKFKEDAKALGVWNKPIRYLFCNPDCSMAIELVKDEE